MNWKKIWFGLIAIGIPLTLIAAQIRWYNDAGIPQKTAIEGNEIMSIQQTGPNAYRWALLSDVKTYMGTSNQTQVVTNWAVYGSNYYEGDTYVSNYFATNIFDNTISSNYFFDFIYYTNIYQTNVSVYEYIAYNTYVSNNVTTNIYADTYVSNYFSTNLFPTTFVYNTNIIGGAFIANLNGMGTNTDLYGDTSFKGDGAGMATFYDASGIIPLAGFNGVQFWGNGGGLTNLDLSGVTQITVSSNTYIINTNVNITQNLTVESNVVVNQTVQAKTAYVTNLVIQTATIFTNVWANGPTGTLDLAISDQNYTAGADMDLTGVINKSNNVVQNVMLTIVASGANRTIYLTGAFAESAGATSYVCTNGVPREIWIRYTPAFGGRTNCCSLSFFRP